MPADLLPAGLTPGLLVLVLVAALAAGWIDAVVGGGGPLQLPALLLLPGMSPAQALATNELASIAGTTTSAVTYHRRVHPDLRTALPMAAVALVGSFAGASVAAALPASVFTPVIVVALVPDGDSIVPIAHRAGRGRDDATVSAAAHGSWPDELIRPIRRAHAAAGAPA